jgi:hypothetical protein
MISCNFYYNPHYYSNNQEYQKIVVELFKPIDNNNVFKGVFATIYNPSTNTFQDQKYYKDFKNINKWVYGQKKISKIYYVNSKDFQQTFDVMISNKNNIKLDVLKKLANHLKYSKTKFLTHLNHYIFDKQDVMDLNAILKNFLTELYKYQVDDTQLTNDTNKQGEREYISIPSTKENEIEFTTLTPEQYNSINESEKTEINLLKNQVKNGEKFISKYSKNIYRKNPVTGELEVYKINKIVPNISFRNSIKLAKVINNTGLKLVKNNLYKFKTNPVNVNYINIDGINVNRNRVEFVDVYVTPPVSNANA